MSESGPNPWLGRKHKFISGCNYIPYGYPYRQHYCFEVCLSRCLRPLGVSAVCVCVGMTGHADFSDSSSSKLAADRAVIYAALMSAKLSDTSVFV